jgi:hypothetical protein
VRKRFATKCEYFCGSCRNSMLNSVSSGLYGAATRKSKTTEDGHVWSLQVWVSTDSANIASASTQSPWRSSGGHAPGSKWLPIHWYVCNYISNVCLKIIADNQYSIHTGAICWQSSATALPASTLATPTIGSSQTTTIQFH